MLPVCPKCDAALFILHFKSVEVDYCDECQGVWLDAGEFDQLAGCGLPELIGATQAATNYLCPRCDSRMNEMQATGNLTIERCPNGHGLWFDATELPRLLGTAAPGTVLTEIFSKPVNP